MLLPLREQVDLTVLYSQPHRRYHNIEHIMDSLAEFERYKLTNGLDEREDEIVTRAIWYHDAVYNPYAPAGLNEKQSGKLALQAVNRSINEDAAMVSEVEDIILATARHIFDQADLPLTAQIMLDTDLVGLGRDWPHYMRNSRNISAEYFQTRYHDFLTGRIGFLEAMLRRKSIYYTAYFKQLYEEQARENMTNELNLIEQELGLE